MTSYGFDVSCQDLLWEEGRHNQPKVFRPFYAKRIWILFWCQHDPFSLLLFPAWMNPWENSARILTHNSSLVMYTSTDNCKLIRNNTFFCCKLMYMKVILFALNNRMCNRVGHFPGFRFLIIRQLPNGFLHITQNSKVLLAKWEMCFDLQKHQTSASFWEK